MKQRSGIIRVLIILSFVQTVLGQSKNGTFLPCEEESRDPDSNNPVDNLSCPFFEPRYCLAASDLCSCVNATDFGTGQSSGGLLAIDCSKLILATVLSRIISTGRTY